MLQKEQSVIQKVNKISNGFIPVMLNSIQENSSLGCNMFLKRNMKYDTGYVLYVDRKSIIKSSNLEQLKKRGIDTLFIHKNDHINYLKHIESNMAKFINDERISVNDKVHTIYNIAKVIAMDMFDSPYIVNEVKRSKNWVIDTVEFILKKREASAVMLNMISHTYCTFTHSVDVAVLGMLFSKHLGFRKEEINDLVVGLLLHDIGKTKINKEIINKTGMLTDTEYLTMREHVKEGVKILEEAGGLTPESLYPVVLHHEREDGMGYPKGLKGSDIHRYGKIASIIDVYNALTTYRPYSSAKSPFAALQIMSKKMLEGFDKNYFRQYVLFLGKIR
ncbi:MAG: HD domain-containing protein [Candidatus Kuenenia sp.]|nr:HD domain-containing protein [Candidatus Kuenenia hertensis]